MRSGNLLSLVFVASFLLVTTEANACTSVLAGRKVTENHVTIIARNEDFTVNNWNKYLAVRSAKTNAPGQTWILGNGLKVPLPRIQYRYSAMPDAASGEEELFATRGRFFEERGINENNVAVSATNSVDVNTLAQKADPLVTPGIEEAVIPTRNSAYWAFKGLWSLGEAHCKYAQKIRRLWQRYEQTFVFEQPYLTEALQKMYKADPAQAVAYASGYSMGIAYRTVGAANSERDVIMTMITKSTDPQ